MVILSDTCEIIGRTFKKFMEIVMLKVCLDLSLSVLGQACGLTAKRRVRTSVSLIRVLRLVLWLWLQLCVNVDPGRQWR